MAGAAGKKGGKKNRKYGRNADYCKLYSGAGLDEAHCKKRMQRHLRRNPNDQYNATRYEQTFGKVQDIGLTARGKRLAQV